MAANQSVTLFISYAHRDEELKTQLDKHLTPLKLQKVIEKWSDRQIEGGQDWAHQIDSNLKSADIILLLVSPDFVSSEYCAGIELKEAMHRYHNGDAVVVPVILEPCDWKWLDFGKLQATPKDGKAITDWPNLNSAFLDVTNNIRQIAQGLLERRQKKLEEKQAAAARYKAKVEEVLSDGDITPLERKTLNELRDLLGLTADEAEAIKDSAYQPLREYKSKLVQYRVDLMETIQAEYPLSERTTADLKQRQRELGLKVEDAERLELELLADAEARHQANMQAGEAAQQRARDDAEQRAAEQTQREALETARRNADTARRQAEAMAQAAATEATRRADAAAALQAEAQAVATAGAQRRADDERRHQEEQQARRAALALSGQRADADADADAAAPRRVDPVAAVVGTPPTPTAATNQNATGMAPPAAATTASTPPPTLPAGAAPTASPIAATISASPGQPGKNRLLGAVIGGLACGVIAALVNMEFIEFIGIVQLFAAAAAVTGAIAGAIGKRCLWFAIPAVTVGAFLFESYQLGAAFLILGLVVAGAIVVAVRSRSTAGP